MSIRKSDERPSTLTRSLTDNENEQQNQENDDSEHKRSASNPEGQTTVIFRNEETPVSSIIRQTNNSMMDQHRSRSKTASTNLADIETISTATSQISTSPSTGFNLLQSIKDLTHQELSRVNPLGLLGKEIISVTGTTHCPEPIPPTEDDDRNQSDPNNQNQPQQIHFPLNEEEKIQMQRRRSTIGNLNETLATTTLAPCPAEYLTNPTKNDLQPHLFSQPLPDTMVADFIPDTMTINVFEVFIYAWGVFAFFFDMITDLVLAHAYYLEGAYWLFILTLMCVIVPNLTLSVFSLVWYIDSSQIKAATNENQTSFYEINSSNDFIENDQEKLRNSSEFISLHEKQNSACQTDDYIIADQTDAHISRIRQRPETPDKNVVKRKHFQLSGATANVLTWIIRIIILVLQLDLCLKYIRGLYYTWKGFQKRHNPKWQRFYLTKQILIDADIALLRVFDCFMDAGSQVTLQLYIMLRLGSTSMKFDTLFVKQSLSIISSLGSLAYALSGYSRCWRHMQLTHSPQGWPKGKPAPQLVSWWSTIIQWVWYLFLITPRVLALAMFAATFRSWFWIILIAHWCGMLFWVLRFRTIFCISDQTKYNPREAIFEKCYNLVCSYIFIFCYMNLRKGDTRTHYIGFYTIYYIENIAFSIIYAIHSAETNLIFKYSLVTFVCVGFWLAILFQFLYYRFLHPSDHVRLSTKQNLSSLIHIRAFKHFDRIKKKSRSCEDMIRENFNDNNELGETTSLQLNTKINERWHNRFAKENRQKLISQQQAIDQKVKLTRLEEATKRRHRPTNSFFTKISTAFKRPTTTIIQEPLENIENQVTQSQPSPITKRTTYQNDNDKERLNKSSVAYISDKRTPYHHQQSKMYNIHEDTHSLDEEQSMNTNNNNNNNKGGKEMILTATKLTADRIPASFSCSAINNNISQLPTATNTSVFL